MMIKKVFFSMATMLTILSVTTISCYAAEVDANAPADTKAVHADLCEFDEATASDAVQVPPSASPVIALPRANFLKSVAGRNGWAFSEGDDTKLINVNGSTLTLSATKASLALGEKLIESEATDQIVFLSSEAYSLLYNCPSLHLWQMDALASESNFVVKESFAETEVRKYEKVDGDMVYTVVVKRDLITQFADSRAGVFRKGISSASCQVYGNLLWTASFESIFETNDIPLVKLVANKVSG